MQSVRVRITFVAGFATALAVSAIAFFLVAQVRSTLLAEIDDSIADQAFDYEAAVFDRTDILFARVPGDLETLFVVVTPDGEVVDTNDTGVDGAEVAARVDFDAAVDGGLVATELSLQSPTDTPGADDMRAVFMGLSNIEDETLYVIFARATASVDRTVVGIRNALLVAVPLLVGFVAALAWWLTGRSLRPVDQMRLEVDDISSSDLSRRVSEPAVADEVGQLAATMNRMLARLEQAQQSQDQFVSDAAHELRTPLASIAAQLDVDKAHPQSADLQKTATNVRFEVSRLQSLINGLLASARNESSMAPAPVQLIDLDMLVGDAVHRVARPASITVDQRAVGAGTVRGDHTSLSSLIDNLLANAYRHANAHVSVGVGTDAAGVWLVVDDDGGGVAPEDRERIFDRFVRLDESRSRDAGGSGLGLALARDAAEQMHGSLSVVDSELGGARFVLRMPNAA